MRSVALLLLCCIVAACGDAVGEAAQRAYERTLPAGASGTGVSISDESTRRVASWQIRTRQSWNEYANWVTQQLMGDFEPVNGRDGGSLLFRKSFAGDLHTLEIRPARDAQGEYLAITFSARPF